MCRDTNFDSKTGLIQIIQAILIKLIKIFKNENVSNVHFCVDYAHFFTKIFPCISQFL